MRQLVHKRRDQDFLDRRFLFLTQLAKPLPISFELTHHDLGEKFLNFDDRRTYIKRAQLFDEMLDLRVNYRFGLAGLVLAFADVRFYDRIKIVDVKQKSVLESGETGIDVSRNRDVDEQHRTLLSRPERPLCFGGTNDVLRRPGRAHHDVSRRKHVVEGFKIDGTARILDGDLFGAFGRAIGDYQFTGSGLDKAAG